MTDAIRSQEGLLLKDALFNCRQLAIAVSVIMLDRYARRRDLRRGV